MSQSKIGCSKPMMSLQERQASTKHNISMEGNRAAMDHVHGLHKGSKALLPAEVGTKTKLLKIILSGVVADEFIQRLNRTKHL